MKDLAGRTFLVTGGNTGIGLATARALAAPSWPVPSDSGSSCLTAPRRQTGRPS
jgi:NAD(P)-dependent dehydrogenase (short-subunit alcohol dehydrogenase family)